MLENEKTVKKLMEQKNGKYIIDLVWKIEKKTEVFNEIKAKRNFMIDNLGFINIINGDYYETNDHMFEMIVAEQEQLKDNFVTKGSFK